MKELIKSEFYKLFKAGAYKKLWGIGIGVTLLSLILDGGYGADFGIKGYDWLCTKRIGINWLLLVLCMYAAEFVAGDFANHTYIFKLMCGFTRRQIYLAKLIGYLTGIMVLLSANTIVGTTARTLINGFGTKLNRELLLQVARSELYYVLPCLGFMGAIPFLFAVVTKSRAGTIGFGVGVNQLFGSLIGNLSFVFMRRKDSTQKIMIEEIFRMMPTYQSASLTAPERFKAHPLWLFLLSCGVCFVFAYFLAMYFFEQSDLE